MFTRKCIRFLLCQDIYVCSTHIITTQMKTEDIPSSPAGSHSCPLPDNSPQAKENSSDFLHTGEFCPFYTSDPFRSVAQLCPTLCDPINHSTQGLPVHHQLPELTQTHVHWVGDAIQPSLPLSSLSPPALNLSQHQGLFKWVSSFHQATKVLELQLQHQSLQWTPRTDLL